MNSFKKKIMLNVLTANDFSMSPRTGLAPHVGYVVSIPTARTPIDLKSLNVANVEAQVDDVIYEAAAIGGFVGGWQDNGLYYLDASINVGSKTTALELKRIWGQKAVYDVVNESCI